MTNKLKYFIGNWKMFGDFGSFKIIQNINKYTYRSRNKYKKKIIICVPNTLIDFFNRKLRSKFITFGAQNCHQSKYYGPFTGSVNSMMLKKVGAKYVIIGHSENRNEGETNSLIREKIIQALKQNLNVIFCIGETLMEKNKNKTFSVLKKQIKDSLNIKFKSGKIILAYEPVWSIGTNKIPKIEELEKTIKYIKANFKKSNMPKILYGGSVNPKNIHLFSSLSDIDGFLIGSASQSSKKFIDIIKNYYK